MAQDTNLYTAVTKLSERVRNLENKEIFTGHDTIAPNYAAPIGTTHWDSNLRRFWANYNGTAGGWQLIGGGGSVTGTGTPPELAYWMAANTIGSATDLEFIANGGIDFQAGGAVPSNATIKCNDNVADALHITDSGGLEILRLNTQNANPYFLIDPARTAGFNIGVGTTSPSEILHIKSDSVETIWLDCVTSSDARLKLTCNNTGDGEIIFADNAADSGIIRYDHNSRLMGFTVEGFQNIFINQLGYFGAGTNTPQRQINSYVNQGNTATVGYLLRLTTLTSGGTAAIGLGVGTEYEIETATASNTQISTRTFSRWTNPILANYSAEWTVEVASNASLIEMLNLDGLNTQPEVCFNDPGNDVDFRIESDTVPYAIFVQGNDGYVGIGQSTPSDKVHVYQETALTNTQQDIIRFDHSTTGTAANGFGSSESWYLEDAGGTLRQALIHNISWTNATAANRSSSLSLDVLSNATLRNLLKLNGLNTQPEVVVNEDGIDCDTRIEVDLDTYGLFVRGSDGNVGIGASNPDQMVEIEQEQGLTGDLTDGYCASLRLDPLYQSDDPYTVTMHNYIEMQDVALVDNASVTDSCHTRFDGRPGVHKCIDDGTTKASPGTVDAWIKFNIDDAVVYVPAYASKTS